VKAPRERVDIRQQLQVRLPEGTTLDLLRGTEIAVRVFSKVNSLRGALRSDPLIGEATLRLGSAEVSGETRQHRLQLLARRGHPQGYLELTVLVHFREVPTSGTFLGNNSASFARSSFFWTPSELDNSELKAWCQKVGVPTQGRERGASGGGPWLAPGGTECAVRGAASTLRAGIIPDWTFHAVAETGAHADKSGRLELAHANLSDGAEGEEAGAAEVPRPTFELPGQALHGGAEARVADYAHPRAGACTLDGEWGPFDALGDGDEGPPDDPGGRAGAPARGAAGAVGETPLAECGRLYHAAVRVLAATAARLCKEYLMGVRRGGASWREALVEDLAKGAPMLTKPGGLAHDRAADPVALLEKYRAEWRGHWNGLSQEAAAERLTFVQGALDAMVADEGLGHQHLRVSAEDVSKAASQFKKGELCVLSIGPKEIGMYFELDVLATTTARADVAARSRHALADDHPGIWWEGLRAVVENKYVTALTRHVVTSLAGGTYMTRQVAHQWGYLIAPACPRCGVTDAPAHRALGCVCFEAGRLGQGENWTEVTPDSALDRKDCRQSDIPESFKRVTEFAHTHDIEWCELTPRPEAGVGDTLLFCKKCCQYATSKPLGLGKACPSFGVVGWQRNEAAQHKMRRFLQGKHPRCGQSEMIIAHWPLLAQVYGACAPEP
ncbi:unnamed protein product, partial [Prorocentrum cordatum]